MHKPASFRKDLRRKLILFGLVPLFIFGAISLWPIYQNEWVRVEKEHKQLLNVVKQIVKVFHRQTQIDFENIDREIRERNDSDLRRLLDRYGKLDSILVVDPETLNVEKVIHHDPSFRTSKLDEEIRTLIQRMGKEEDASARTLYYSPHFGKVLATHLFRHGGKIYVVNIDAHRYLKGIDSLIQRSDIRSVFITTPTGKYIYNSTGMEPIIRGDSLFKSSDYLAAIKNKKPYQVTEYPTHYQEGDSFWEGLFDLDSFLSYAPVPEANLTVAVKDSEDTIDYYLGGLLLIWVGLMLFTILIVLAVSRVMLNYIVQPVEKTIRNIDNLSKGLPPVHEEAPEKTYSIFADLMESFERMRKKVIDREEKLNEQLIINTEIQQKLAQNEKKAALGDITSNIAHQWRQPLSTISTLATGMLVEKRMGTLTDESLEKYCRQINDNAQYLSNTIEDFRQFALEKQEEEYFDAEESIKSLIKIMENRLREQKIHPKIQIRQGLKIFGYSNHFLQMMINLVGNAVDALQNLPENERFLGISITDDRDAIVIRVRDNGGGVDPEILNRIFEPYFTTKHKSQGTGLGLHMAQRLAEESLQGTIRVENVTFTHRGKEYRGAEFVIVLPKNPDR